MMRVDEGSGAPAPRQGWWRRMLSRLGLARRSRAPHQLTAQELFEAQQRYYAQQVAAQQAMPPAAQAPAASQPQPAPAPGVAPPPAPQGPPTGAHHPPPAGAAPPRQVAPQVPPSPPADPLPDPTPAQREDLVTKTLAGLAMRDLTLVDSLIDHVEALEDSSEDPELLEKLFKIDNLATRMRRNGENLLVLAGQDTGESSTEPVPLLDVARAAISEISEYQRVQLGRLPEVSIAGASADDLSHLLAELMDNATEKSPDHAQVVVSAQSMSEGRLLVTVEDEGIGIPAQQLTELNNRLGGEPVLDEQVVRRMGLYVVSRIAHRHGLQVQLETRAFRGVSAHVVVPAGLFSSGERREPRPAPRAAARPSPSASPTLESTSPREPTSPSAPVAREPQRQQEKSTAMDSSVTAAGLPRRSAHRSTPPAAVTPPDEAGPAAPDDSGASERSSNGDGGGRAERIRADLEGFIEGQQAARPDE